MGTRSLTIIKADEWGEVEEIAVLYRQFDGYFDGHGMELAEFLSGIKVVNGLSSYGDKSVANGATCLAARLISHFKGDDPGGFYLYPAGARNKGEEYVYTVTAGHDKPITLEASGYGGEFKGDPSEFSAWVASLEEEEAE